MLEKHHRAAARRCIHIHQLLQEVFSRLSRSSSEAGSQVYGLAVQTCGRALGFYCGGMSSTDGGTDARVRLQSRALYQSAANHTEQHSLCVRTAARRAGRVRPPRCFECPLSRPLSFLSSVHFCTYKEKFISLYCRLSSVLDLDALITQQALREAITDGEVATAKQRHQLILDYIQVTFGRL